MNLKLVKASLEYKDLIIDMMNEWTATDEKIVPYAIRKHDYNDFENYLSSLENQDESNGLVPDSTFFVTTSIEKL